MKNRILVVDDLAFVRMMIKEILHKYGYQVVGEASNGIEAVKLYMQLRPDAVLMDITMDQMNGIDALKKIKEIDPNAIVIMCSALGQQQIIINAIKLGAKDFVVKPFKEERIISALKKAIV
ncbi:MAG: response regulator [Spirochaetes bacterium]|nr:response regulator [Spirochaetota bacterium]